MDTEPTKEEVKAKQIQEDFQRACFEAGHLNFQIKCLTRDLENAELKQHNLNIEYRKLAQIVPKTTKIETPEVTQ